MLYSFLPLSFFLFLTKSNETKNSRVLPFLIISHTYTNEQIFTNFITSPTSNQIYIPSRIWNSLPTWFSKNLFLNNLSLLARSIFVLQNGGAFLLEFPPWLEFRLENGRARPSPGNPSLHARNRNDSRSRDEIVSSLFRGAGRGAVHVNNSRSPCERVSFSTEQRASNSSFFLPTGKWYCSPLLASIVTPNFSWIGGIIGSNRWISSEMFRALIEYYYTLRNALILDLFLFFDRKILSIEGIED